MSLVVRNRAQRRRGVVPRLVALPSVRRVLKYFFFLNSSAASRPVVRVFRGNDLFDPDQTGVGHQPMGFDQYMALYRKFRVLRSRATVTCFSQGTGATSQYIVGIVPLQSTTAKSISDYLETDRCLYRPLGIIGAGNGVTISTDWMDTRVMFADVAGEDDDLSGTNAASPADVWYWHHFADSHDESTTVSVTHHIVLEYDAVFSDPVDLTAS